MKTSLEDALAYFDFVGRGRDLRLTQAAMQALAFGHRVAFLELWCGCMRLTMGVRAQGLLAPMGLDQLYPLGIRRWDLSNAEGQEACDELVDVVDPLVLHGAPPSDELSQQALHQGQKGFDRKAYDRAVQVVNFYIGQLRKRVQSKAAGSLESPKGAKTWHCKKVVEFFGTPKEPLPDRYFVDPDMCMYGLKDPVELDKFYHKSMLFAATYPEIQGVNEKCDKSHDHRPVRGRVKVLGRGHVSRGVLSGAYTLQLGLKWGERVAAA